MDSDGDLWLFGCVCRLSHLIEMSDPKGSFLQEILSQCIIVPFTMVSTSSAMTPRTSAGPSEEVWPRHESCIVDLRYIGRRVATLFDPRQLDKTGGQRSDKGFL